MQGADQLSTHPASPSIRRYKHHRDVTSSSVIAPVPSCSRGASASAIAAVRSHSRPDHQARRRIGKLVLDACDPGRRRADPASDDRRAPHLESVTALFWHSDAERQRRSTGPAESKLYSGSAGMEMNSRSTRPQLPPTEFEQEFRADDRDLPDVQSGA
jgi:hypothetical protein